MDTVFIKETFDICVAILYYIAEITGLTYKEANIWIFVIIHPIITLTLFFTTIRYYIISKFIKK